MSARDPRYCSIRRGWCDCSTRCEDWPDMPPASRVMRPTMVCQRCKTETELYGSHPHCRECTDTVCEACGTDYDAETGSITCKACATEERRA